VTTISSASDYQSSCEAEASLAGGNKLTSVSANASLTSSLALSTQTLGVVASGKMVGPTFQLDKDDFDAAEISSHIDPNAFKSYSEFVAKYGSHFIGGYITGASYSAAYQMDCSSYSDTQTLSASLKASDSDVAFSASFSASVQAAKTASGVHCNTSWYQTAIGWPNNAPSLEAATSTGIDDNIAHFLQFKSTELTLPIAYVCYDWRMIDAIQQCAWAQTPDIDMQQMGSNLPTVAGAYQQLQFAQTSANNSISNVYYVGDSQKTSLAVILQTAKSNLAYISSLSVNDVANLNVTAFENQHDVGSALTAQVQQINRGDAMIGWSFTAGSTFTPTGPETGITSAPVQPNGTGKFHTAWTNKKDGDTYLWGYIYNADKTLQAKFGRVDSKGNFTSYSFTSKPIQFQPGAGNYITVSSTEYTWQSATVWFS